MSKEYRTELIQVAAVAIAAVEAHDILTRQAAGQHGGPTEDIIIEVAQERIKQNEKWGQQLHDPFGWLAILGEEYGEACQAAVDANTDWPGVRTPVWDEDQKFVGWEGDGDT